MQRVLGLAALSAAIAASALAGCRNGGTRVDARPSGTPSSEQAAPPTAGALPAQPWAAGDAPPKRDADGIVVIELAPEPAAQQGDLRPLSDAWKTLTFAQMHASDGETTFVAVRNDAQRFSDVMVRGGKLFVDVLAKLSGVSPHPGGCAAASDGRLLLSAPLEAGDYPRSQAIFLLDRAGRSQRLEVPREAGADRECKALLEPDGDFALFLSNLLVSTGGAMRVERGWYKGRAHFGGVEAPRYCFQYCNAQEKSASDPEGAKLLSALGCNATSFAVMGEWLAARCGTDGAVARMKRGGAPELLRALPKADYLADDIFFTQSGDLVIELSLRARRYVVWKVGQQSHGPERKLSAEREVMAQTSPTLLVRGLPEGTPPGTVSAVLLGEPISYGASGSTFDYQALERGETARRAQFARAKRVLPKGTLWAAHEAVVQMECGAYVRSPVGWEGLRIHDWIPPTLPPLSPKAVHRPKTCLPLASVAALPGNPDLLIAKTKKGELALAWLPPPLPLPTGRDPRRDGPDLPAPKQNPRPGSGWTIVAPAVDAIDAIAGAREPGHDVPVRARAWQAGGGAVLRFGSSEIVLTPRGAWTLPSAATPMAVDRTTPRLYALVGSDLIVCDSACRALPAAKERVIAVVPRTKDQVILGLSTGKSAVYRVPATGGRVTAPHPLESALEKFLATRP